MSRAKVAGGDLCGVSLGPMQLSEALSFAYTTLVLPRHGPADVMREPRSDTPETWPRLVCAVQATDRSPDLVSPQVHLGARALEPAAAAPVRPPG